MNAEIQIQFPQPGNWQEFTLTAVYEDAGGYTRTVRYTPADIPAEQAPAMQAVVAALVGLGGTVAGGAGVGTAERVLRSGGSRGTDR